MMSILAEFVPDIFGGGGNITWDQVLQHYVWVFYAAFIVAFLFTPIMRGVATYYGIIDQPDRLRKMHNVPVAYLGGVAVFLVVACCNATNLMDGLDGLCGGVTAVISGGFLFLAVHLAMSTGGLDPNLDAMRVVIAIALLGAVLGFIPYNFNPASIFMGDTGSMFLGFCCAVMIILM